MDAYIPIASRGMYTQIQTSIDKYIVSWASHKEDVGNKLRGQPITPLPSAEHAPHPCLLAMHPTSPLPHLSRRPPPIPVFLRSNPRPLPSHSILSPSPCVSLLAKAATLPPLCITLPLSLFSHNTKIKGRRE